MLKQLFVHTATPREALAPRTTIGPAIGARGCPSEVGAAALDREFLVGIDGHRPHGIGDSTALALIRGATAGWRARAHDSRRIHGSSDHIDITEQPARLQLDDRSLLAEFHCGSSDFPTGPAGNASITFSVDGSPGFVPRFIEDHINSREI
jgi:hypothetical protein